MEASPDAAADEQAPAPQERSFTTACPILAAHFLARWAWRSWEFSVALLLLHLYPASLQLVAVYGLLDDLCSLVFGPAAGSYVDRAPRLRSATVMYMLQNACIMTSAGAAALLLQLADSTAAGQQGPHQAFYGPLMAVVIVAGACCSIGSMGATLSVEKDWTKTLANGDAAVLSRLNAGMRAIDLACQMLAPAAAGIIMTYAGMRAAVLIMALYSAAAWAPEVVLLRVAHRSPLLRSPKVLPPTRTAGSSAGMSSSSTCRAASRLLCRPCGAVATGWPVYWAQPTLVPAVALALLYLTVLSLGFLMTSYLKAQGMTEATISYFRGAGALSGLSATAMFPLLQRQLGLKWTGLAGISWQLLCLCWAVLPAALMHMGLVQVHPEPQGHPLLLVLLVGLVLSRAGLWLFDLAVSQLQQEAAHPDEIGTVAGVQGSLSSLVEILSFVAGLAVPDVQHFHVLMLGSLSAVTLAAVLYSAWCVCHGQRAGASYASIPTSELSPRSSGEHV